MEVSISSVETGRYASADEAESTLRIDVHLRGEAPELHDKPIVEMAKYAVNG